MELYHLDWRKAAELGDAAITDLVMPQPDDAAFARDIRLALARGLYRKVATVTADTLGDVFPLTQNIDDAWSQNPRPGVSPEGAGPHRSTSVGDVIVDNDGTRYAVAAIGLVAISAGDTKDWTGTVH